MEENFSEENKTNRRKFTEEELILRKSLLRGQTSKIAHDNVKLRANVRQMAKNFLKGNKG